MVDQLIIVNGTPLPMASTAKFGYYTISDAARNTKGVMIKEDIAEKFKIELMWRYLPQEELSKLLKLVQASSLTVQCLSPYHDDMTTFEMYVGDRAMGLYTISEGVPVYTDITMNFIEL